MKPRIIPLAPLSFTQYLRKGGLVVLLAITLFAACKKAELDELYVHNNQVPGDYIVTQVPAELHHLEWPYRTVWSIHNDTFQIHLYDSVWHTNGSLQVFGKDSLIHFETGINLDGQPIELFLKDGGENAFFPYESLSGSIFFSSPNYVSYGSYLNRAFTLNKITIHD